LKKQKAQLETRLEELERLESSQDEIQNIISEAIRYISSLEFILKNGLPQEKLVALRQCIKRIALNKSAGEIEMVVCVVPIGNLQATQELITSFG
jgi:hypothetical protein